MIPTCIKTSYAPDDPELVRLITSGVIGKRRATDPLAGMDLALRLQTHRGDRVPLGLYQDTALTDPAEINDAVAGWDWPGLPAATQSNAFERGTLRDFDGVPVLEFDAGKGMASSVYVGGPDWAISILEIPTEISAGIRTIQSVEYNRIMAPGRTDNRYFVDGPATDDNTPAPVGVPVIATMGTDAGVIKVWQDGIDITAASPITAFDFGTLAIGNGGVSADAAFTKLLAVIVHKYADREAITTYLESLKPPTV